MIIASARKKGTNSALALHALSSFIVFLTTNFPNEVGPKYECKPSIKSDHLTSYQIV